MHKNECEKITVRHRVGDISSERTSLPREHTFTITDFLLVMVYMTNGRSRVTYDCGTLCVRIVQARAQTPGGGVMLPEKTMAV